MLPSNWYKNKMEKIDKRKRFNYTLWLGETKIGTSTSIEGIGELLELSKNHVYSHLKKTPYQFSFRKRIYNITKEVYAGE